MASLLERLGDAMNSHDPVRVASLVAQDYESSQPAHPARAFGGREQVLANWSAVFQGVPDFTAREGDIDAAVRDLYRSPTSD